MFGPFNTPTFNVVTKPQKAKLKLAFLTAAIVGLGKALGTGIGRVAEEAIRRGLGWHDDDDPPDHDDPPEEDEGVK